MAAWKYYAAERARHPKALAHKLTRSQMVEFSGKLALHFGEQPVPVFFSDRKDVDGAHAAPPLPMKAKRKFDTLSGKYVIVRVPVRTRKFQRPDWSCYSSSDKVLVYGVNMFDALTVAHEVAHYLVRQNYYASVRAGTRKGKYVSHGVEHREQVDKCVAVLTKMLHSAEVFTATFTKENGQFVEVPPGRPSVYRFSDIFPVPVTLTTAPVPPADPVAAFFDSLPPLLTCPCCNATLPKMNFGVRVMKRDANNVPTVIRRQSYCRACR